MAMATLMFPIGPVSAFLCLSFFLPPGMGNDLACLASLGEEVKVGAFALEKADEFTYNDPIDKSVSAHQVRHLEDSTVFGFYPSFGLSKSVFAETFAVLRNLNF